MFMVLGLKGFSFKNPLMAELYPSFVHIQSHTRAFLDSSIFGLDYLWTRHLMGLVDTST